MTKASKKAIQDYIFFHLNVKGNTNKDLILNLFVGFVESKPIEISSENLEKFIQNTDLFLIDKEQYRIIQLGIEFKLLKPNSTKEVKENFVKNWFTLIANEIIFLFNNRETI